MPSAWRRVAGGAMGREAGAEYLIVRGDYPDCVPLVPARAYPDGSDDSAANPGTRHTSGAASADSLSGSRRLGIRSPERATRPARGFPG